jgi:tetratricopeptide (TPR) repeat protein
MNKLFIRAEYKIGNLYLKQGKYLEAIETFRTVVEKDPNHFKAYSNLGLALKTVGLFEEAILMYERSLKIHPGQAVVHNNLGSLYTSKGDIKKAITYFEEAISLDPLYKNAFYNLGSVLYHTGSLARGLELLAKSEEIKTGNRVTVKRKKVFGYKPKTLLKGS